MEIQGTDRRRAELDPDSPPAMPPPPSTPTESDERALACLRYQSFAEGTPPPQTDPAWSDEKECGGAVKHTVLWRVDPGEAEAADRAEVAQGDLGDCSLMATLSILTSFPQGRALIESMVIEHKDDQGQTKSYTVTLFRPGKTSSGQPPTYWPVRIEVDPKICWNYAKPRSEGDSYEVWSQVIEKAFCIYVGGKDKINVPANQALELVTGRPATRSSIKGFLFGEYTGQRLVSDLQAGKLIVLTSKPDAPPGWVSNHAYAVLGVEMHDGKLCAIVHNPWNRSDSEPAPVPLDEIRRYFDFANVGSL